MIRRALGRLDADAGTQLKGRVDRLPVAAILVDALSRLEGEGASGLRDLGPSLQQRSDPGKAVLKVGVRHTLQGELEGGPVPSASSIDSGTVGKEKPNRV